MFILGEMNQRTDFCPNQNLLASRLDIWSKKSIKMALNNTTAQSNQKSYWIYPSKSRIDAVQAQNTTQIFCDELGDTVYHLNKSSGCQAFRFASRFLIDLYIINIHIKKYIPISSCVVNWLFPLVLGKKFKCFLMARQ